MSTGINATPYEHLNAGLPLQTELLFPNVNFRRTKEGPVHRLSFEVDEELWNAFKHLPSNIRLGATLWIQPDDEGESGASETVAEQEREEKTQPVQTVAQNKTSRKGPYQSFVKHLFVLGFFMSLGKAAVFKHIPVYYSGRVGPVGGVAQGRDPGRHVGGVEILVVERQLTQAAVDGDVETLGRPEFYGHLGQLPVQRSRPQAAHQHQDVRHDKSSFRSLTRFGPSSHEATGPRSD